MASSSSRLSKRPRPSPTTALMEHLETHGAQRNAIEFRESCSGSGIGGFAARDIKRGEVIMSIPLNMAITSSRAKDWYFQEIDTTCGSAAPSFVDGEFFVCMFLIAAKRRRHDSIPRVAQLYTAALSEKAPDTCSWDEHSRRILSGSVAKATLKARNEVMSWAIYCKKIWPVEEERHGNAPSFDEILWARGHCKSRRFPETLVLASTNQTQSVSSTCKGTDDLTVKYSLLPGLDLLNHSNDPAIMEWKTDWKRKTLEFRALKGVAKGSEVFNHYGPKSNTSLLFNHGFALKSNPYDVYEARLMGASEDAQAVVLWSGRFTGSEDRLPLGLLEHFAEEHEEEVGGHSRETNANQLYVSKEATEFLSSWLNSLLVSFAPKSVDEHLESATQMDDSSLKQTNGAYNLRLKWVDHYREGQTKILRHMLQLIQEYQH